jgi:hypothetical protein
MEGSNVWWPMEGEKEAPFHLFLLSPKIILLQFSIFPLILRLYSTMVLGHYLLITTTHFDVISPPHIHYRFDFD